MLITSIHPHIGCWYYSAEMEEIFEVVAMDDDDDSIDIQFFAGEIDEVDSEIWLAIHATEVAEPEDWSGAYIMSHEDLGNYFNEVIYPEKWDKHALELEEIG